MKWPDSRLKLALSHPIDVEYIVNSSFKQAAWIDRESRVFTGLVEEKAIVESIDRTGRDNGESDGNARISISTKLVSQDAVIGDSISVNGCCLTVVEIRDGVLSFDAVPETLLRTNLGELKVNSPVNLERALKPDTRLGGHYVTGHIDGLGTISRIETHPDWRKIHVLVAESLAVQMASKGSVAIDGVSLTLVDVGNDSFSVVLIPHTLKETTIGDRNEGDPVNIETDLLAKYVERQMLVLNSLDRASE